MCPNKNLQDKRNVGGENEITDSFLVSAGCEAIIKISVMVHSKDLEEITFQEIKQIIRNKQNSNKSARFYLQRLKEASRFCEFEELGTENITIDEELIQLCFIEGLQDMLMVYQD